MRISDWSSDVCSSDFKRRGEAATRLGQPHAQPAEPRHLAPGLLGEIARRPAVAPFGERQLLPNDFARAVAQHRLGFVERKIDRHPLFPSVFPQIGRASCRERVCQYVSLSVVAVTLKQKRPTKLTRSTTTDLDT